MPRIQLQPRDLDMLASLGAARMLTVPAIEWLHYPHWRERYRRYLEQADPALPRAYRPRAQVYARMARLRDCHLVATIARRVDRKVALHYRQYESLPAVYCLTPAGSELLLEQRHAHIAPLWVYHERSGRSVQNTDHSALIGQCYAALRSEAHHRGQQFRDWIGDYALRASHPQHGPNYDRVTLVGQPQAVSLIPDGACFLNDTLLFVEIDRSTQSMQRWVEKIRAYDQYQHSALLQRRYGVSQFVVLIVTLDARRLERIAGEIARTSRQYRQHYRLIEERLVHPTTIRRGWRQVLSAQFAPRLIGQRLIETVVEIQLEQAPLWPADSESARSNP
jgi:hypothetical protein